jgi:hypothetical protein
MIPITCTECNRTDLTGSPGGLCWRRLDIESGLGVCAECSSIPVYESFHRLVMLYGRHPRVRACFRCRSVIVVLETTKGRHVPVDASYVRPGDTRLDLSRHQPHLATCRQVRDLYLASQRSEGL